MVKAITHKLVQRAAASLYQWYLGTETPDRTGEQIYRWISSGTDLSPFSARDISLYLTRVHNHPGFAKVREAMLTRWRAKMDTCQNRPDRHLAKHFLNDWIENQDHSLLLNQSLLAGLTRIHAHQLGDTTTFLYGLRRFWTLHLTLKGAATYTSDRDFEAHKGDILLIEPGARCHYRRHPESESWIHAWIAFQPREGWSQWLRWPSSARGIQHLRLHKHLLEEAQSLVTQIQELSREESLLSAELGLNLLEQLLIRIARAASRNHQSPADSRVERACEYLRQHIADPITVEDVAGHCHVSPSRIAHLFKRDQGISLLQYRNQLRLQEARQLLLTSDMRVEAIAGQIGYSDPAQFSKYFRKHNGCSPRAFRSKHTRD